MIIDFRQADAPTDFHAGLCIVGSGPIGLSIAAEFLSAANANVLVVESGGRKVSAAHNALNIVINTGDAPSALEGSRARVFGGTSTLWGGQAIPLSPIDFERRLWVTNSGWPIRRDSLTDYFDRAAALLEIDGADFDRDIWKKGSGFKTRIDAQQLRLTFSRWSPSPDFSKKFLRTIRDSTRVTSLLHATVTAVELDETGRRVDYLMIRDLSGRAGRIRADRFVLCGGGIENARLLLGSTSRIPAGVGNAFGNVGRYFQDHAAYYVARLIPRNFDSFVNLFSSYFNGSQMYLPKLQLSEVAQRETGSLNVIGNVGVEYKEAAVALKRLFNDLKTRSVDSGTLAHFAKTLKDPRETIRLLVSYGLRRRMYYPRNADYYLIANCESEPLSDSCISLSRECDPLGMPTATIHWIVTDRIKASLRDYVERVKRELDRLGIADTVVKSTLQEEGTAWKTSAFSIYHHIGTTRMSDRPEDGVVDQDCRVHGIHNLYVAGTSVFPTSGCANPTYTALALAIRLADHLKRSPRI